MKIDPMVGFKVWIQGQSDKALFIARKNVNGCNYREGSGFEIKPFKSTFPLYDEDRVLVGDFKHHRFVQCAFRGKYDWRKPIVFWLCARIFLRCLLSRRRT